MTILINIFLKIMGYSPIMGLTDDDNFILCKTESKRKRISLINLHLGAIQIQIVSLLLTKPCEFKLLRVFKMNEIDKFILDVNKAEQLERDYRKHLESIDINDIDIETATLERHFNNNWNRTAASISKIDILSSITFVVVPIFFWQMDFIGKIRALSWSIERLIIMALMYALINLVAWLFQALSVKAISMSTFGDLKRAKDKKKEFCWQLYYDWQSIKRSSDLAVSYVSYILESYIIIFILCLILLITNSMGGVRNKHVDVDKRIYNIDVEDLTDVYSESSMTWNKVEYLLIREKPSEVIVLGNPTVADKVEKLLLEYTESDIITFREDTTESNKVVKILIKE